VQGGADIAQKKEAGIRTLALEMRRNHEEETPAGKGIHRSPENLKGNMKRPEKTRPSATKAEVLDACWEGGLGEEGERCSQAHRIREEKKRN